MAVTFDQLESLMSNLIAQQMASETNAAIESMIAANPALAGALAADKTSADFQLFARPIAYAVRQALETYDAG